MDIRVEQWLKEAECDLEAAEILREGQLFGRSTFFSQQAAEKAVKALYISVHHELAPKTHKVDSLADELDAPFDVVQRAAYLTAEYIASRYPDSALALELPSAFYTAEIAGERIGDARMILEWVRGRLRNA